MKQIARHCFASALAACIAGAAQADPLVLTTNFNVWHGNSPAPGDSTDPTQQALPTNPLTSQTYIGFFSYSGAFSFANTIQATDLMSSFIPGVGLPDVQMSAPPFDLASLFEFTFIMPADVTGATLTHDDGVSLYDLTDNSDNLIPGQSAPTSATTTALPTLIGGHNYELWYAATNGAPSILSLDVSAAVPEPSTWAMLLAGFASTGVILRRRKSMSARMPSAI